MRSEDEVDIIALIKETILSAKALAEDCGNGPLGLKCKRELGNQINACRKVLYKAIHGCWPDFELPDNWEGES